MDELRRQMGLLQSAAVAQLNYAKSLLLLGALKAGRVKLENVFLDGDNWSLVEVVAPPPEAEVAAEVQAAGVQAHAPTGE